ncbi:hypothetical protein TWF173_007526 [Orbilia oligospora]|uniref:Uncharacterized protein n=1 Tax=Orbilia oligospora TaxID=2813651 RepID=A0A7C8VBF8_ORBOL|nr:hypothetical protein TWF970_007862 [Orbilia oligospora]KAF3312032.1 hypothetical protein TWF173_007526 [Orbilia oligospora]
MSCVEAQREVRDDSLQKVNYGAGQFDRSPRYGPYEDVVFDGRDWGANAGLERGTGRVYRRKRGKQDDAKYQVRKYVAAMLSYMVLYVCPNLQGAKYTKYRSLESDGA